MFKKLSLICIITLCGASANTPPHNADTLEKLDVKANESKETTYTSNDASVDLGDISNDTQNLDQILRKTPGTFTQIDPLQGALSVNIRSLNGQGRVNTFIDGVPNKFYGNANDNTGSYHGGVLGTSLSGVLLEQGFINDISIDKGTFSGGGNGLVGGVNFKTFSVNDIVEKDNLFGLLARYSYGSNKIGPSYTGIIAGKIPLEDNGYFGVLFGYSGKKLRQNYKTGSNKTIGDESSSVVDENGDLTLTTPDFESLTQKPKNYLAKIEVSPNENLSLDFSLKALDVTLDKRDISSRNYKTSYHLTPDSDLINLSATYGYNQYKQSYHEEARFGSGNMGGTKLINEGYFADINNQAFFGDDDLFISPIIGINTIQTNYSKINAHGTFNTNIEPDQYAAMLPEGDTSELNAYFGFNSGYKILNFNANFNLNKTRLSGYKGQCYDENFYCDYKPAGIYDKDYKFFDSSFVLSLNAYKLARPFISYSITHRAPTIYEFYLSNAASTDINTKLKEEKAKTYQIGINGYDENILFDDDVLGYKVVYYNTKIKDFIYDRVMIDPVFSTIRFNNKDNATLKGVELSFSYDIGVFYTNISHSYQKSKYPISDTAMMDAGDFAQPFAGQSQYSVLPKYYGNVDLGTRLFDKKLTFGTNIKYTGKATRIDPLFDGNGYEMSQNENVFRKYQTEELPKIPTIVDLYTIYKPIKGLTFKLEVQNVFNKDYMDALYMYNSSTGLVSGEADTSWGEQTTKYYDNKARGRTFIGSFEYKY